MGSKTDVTIREKIEEFLAEKNFFTDGLAMIEEKTGVPRKMLLGACVAFLALYLVIGYAGGLLVNLLGFAYPAYMSVKAVESEDKEDDTQWLTYWVVYGFFGIVEFFSDMFLGWFPFYFLFKCAFLVWCMAPFSWNGANFIYNKVLVPFVKQHEKDISAFVDRAQTEVGAFVSEAEKQAKDFAIDAMADKMKSDSEAKKDE